MRMIGFCIGAVCLALGSGICFSGPIQVDPSQLLQARQPVILRQIMNLTDGGRQIFQFHLDRIESLDLRIPFTETPFNGTQLNVLINGHRLLPYYVLTCPQDTHERLRRIKFPISDAFGMMKCRLTQALG